jgi:hypothetical protein
MFKALRTACSFAFCKALVRMCMLQAACVSAIRTIVSTL